MNSTIVKSLTLLIDKACIFYQKKYCKQVKTWVFVGIKNIIHQLKKYLSW
ncbi:hypothetical protein [uncultured Gammaproteobacteria bacterium]|nr:hypothetical protein BROOK1789C_2172 [Bathymodiolus brooksi thiotrophic gill symbiont]CAC9532509.1 hypothetical protein [uncultured Gammaproteobacteria bacterium]CAC9550412.1 hypothetical protein [uncultured Gammaproteobacteria bacterium]CAC9594794.1 hypothetical protein [uncultured Gammaproteobacteria bacterium]CAC9626266.1 hypothetical protein [uncultured Gammaproteobacteria bacterium]